MLKKASLFALVFSASLVAHAAEGPYIKRGVDSAPHVEDASDELPPASRPEQPGDKASTGSSRAPNATRGSSASDNEAIEADEDRAKQNKDKFKQRPGFREDPPQPRA